MKRKIVQTDLTLFSPTKVPRAHKSHIIEIYSDDGDEALTRHEISSNYEISKVYRHHHNQAQRLIYVDNAANVDKEKQIIDYAARQNAEEEIINLYNPIDAEQFEQSISEDDNIIIIAQCHWDDKTVAGLDGEELIDLILVILNNTNKKLNNLEFVVCNFGNEEFTEYRQMVIENLKDRFNLITSYNALCSADCLNNQKLWIIFTGDLECEDKLIYQDDDTFKLITVAQETQPLSVKSFCY